jgi:alanine racemase
MVHAANSAAAIDHPRARYDMVRVGISVYGIPPASALAGRIPLQPALSLSADVSMVKRVHAGEAISYGHRHRFARDTTVATVPIGYADGVPRGLPLRGGEVLVAGRRRPITGIVTMDQLMVDCGDLDVTVGDEVVLLGRQGGEQITADEWAVRMDTIAYEIVCGIGPRVPRHFHR